MENNQLKNSELTIISSDVAVEGQMEINHELHLYGKITGTLRGKAGSLIILKEGSVVEGQIHSDTLIIEGFVKGEIQSTQKVWITSLGRVVGSVKTPSLQVDPGAIFEAKVKM
jgi:cytoskeletal protein CcmA (bactofilin family)